MHRIFRLLASNGNKAVLTLALVATVSLYVRLLGMGLFWDDHRIFENEVILRGGNPLLFWLRGQPETKSWPLLFSFYWGFFQWFGPSALAFHTLNLLVHLLNGLVLYRIAAVWGSKWPAVPASIFLLHPMMVESVGWIFQLSKLLSAHFLLLWFYLGIRRGGTHPGWRFIPLLGALLVGGYAYLIAALEGGRLLLGLRGSGHKSRFLGVCLIGTCAYLVFLVAAGTNPRGSSDWAARTYQSQFGPVLGCKLEAKAISVPLTEASSRSAARYLADAFGLGRQTLGETACLWAMKIASAGITTTSYLRRFLFPLPERIPNPATAPSTFPFLVYLALGLGLLGSVFLILRMNSSLRAAFLTFLPVSGVFYFSWLDFALTADRLFYVPAAFLVLFFWWWMEPRIPRFPWTRAVVAVWVMFLLVEAQLRVSYLQVLYAMPFRCVICSVPP